MAMRLSLSIDHFTSHGEAVLRLERLRDDEVVAGWIAAISVSDFLSRIEPEDRLKLTVSRRSAASTQVFAARLRNPEELTAEEADSIHLVRLDLPGAAVVWERADDSHTDVAVLAPTWSDAERHLSEFIPPGERAQVSADIAAFSASSGRPSKH
jgi:hypothetical protein